MSSAEKYIPNYTVDDFQHWEGDWELWDGIPVSMSPSPFGRHSKILGKVATALNIAIDNAKCDASALVQIDWNISDNTILRPDLTVVCGQPPVKHVMATPAVVVEVLSPSTRDRDLGAKLEIYQTQKVPWYLILDPESNQLIARKLGDDGRYVAVSSSESSKLDVSICEDCNLEIKTGRLFV